MKAVLYNLIKHSVRWEGLLLLPQLVIYTITIHILLNIEQTITLGALLLTFMFLLVGITIFMTVSLEIAEIHTVSYLKQTTYWSLLAMYVLLTGCILCFTWLHVDSFSLSTWFILFSLFLNGFQFTCMIKRLKNYTFIWKEKESY